MEEKKNFEYLVMLMPCPKHSFVNRYNGYVAFDKNSPWYTEHPQTEDGNKFEWIECNGGITFTENLKKKSLKNFEIIDGDIDKLDDDVLVIGFDTLHAWDTDQMWPKERVAIEAERIHQQLINSKPEDYEESDAYYREMAEPDPDEFKSEYEDNKFIGYE